jgi:hypothetical protein
MTMAGFTTTAGAWAGGAGSGNQGFMLSGGGGGGGIGGIGSLGGLIGQALSGPAPQAPTQGTSGTTTAPTQLQTDMKKLQTDLQAINDKSQVTPALIAAVRNDTQKIQSEATTAPDQTKLSTLESDVQALNGQLPTDAQKTQLESDFTAVVQSEGVSDSTLISQTISDIEAVVAATNVTSADMATIAADRKAIQTDLDTATGTTAATGQAAGVQFLDGLTGGSLGGPMLQTSAVSVPAGSMRAYFPGGPMLSGGPNGGGTMLVRSTGGVQSSGFGVPYGGNFGI